MEEEVEGHEDAEGGVAIVDGVGVDAVDTEEDERGRKQSGDEGWALQPVLEKTTQDRPGDDCCSGSGKRSVEDVVQVHTAGEVDDGGLNEERQGCVREGEVAVGVLAESDAVATVEEVAKVPEDGDVGIVPEGDGSGGEEE